MAKLLLAEALAQLAPEALPAETNMQVPWINAVCAQFLCTGKWAGTTMRWKGSSAAVNFAVFEDEFTGLYFTLPRNLLCLLAEAHGTTDTIASRVRYSSTPIRGQWHEFGNAGFGAGDTVASTGAHDAGDGFTTFRDFSEASYLRVKTETTEAASTIILFRGLDENGEEIFSGTGSGSYQGINLDISAGLTTTTSQQFSGPRPTLIQKPVTRAPIRLYAVSVSDATETLIGLYQPGEITPSYRRYSLSPCSNAATVHAMAKRRHVPAIVGADELVPANLTAIEYGLMGRRFDLSSDPKSAAGYWSRAFGLLNSELNEDHGSTTAQLQFARGGGLADFVSIH